MEFINSQFSITFDRKEDIKRMANDIEDSFSSHYENIQILPIPDNFTPSAPRIIMTSKHGHSQIVFTQISVIFDVKYDNNYSKDSQKIKDYIKERYHEISEALPKIGIFNCLYCGLTHQLKIDREDNIPPVDYITNSMHFPVSAYPNSHVYDAFLSYTTAWDNYFINEQLSVVKKYDESNNTIPELARFSEDKVSDEKLMLMLDVNNRMQYFQTGKNIEVEELTNIFSSIYDISSERIAKWEEHNNG